MILYMKSSRFDTRIDRIMDALLDRQHPFWRDERQRAVYTEQPLPHWFFSRHCSQSSVALHCWWAGADFSV